jgi:hypothetical protein
MTQHHMNCCVCGAYAGRWQQHWNRDTGYSICPPCAAEEAGRLDPKELVSLYGTPGVNYDAPMVRHQGRRYRCMAVFKNTEDGMAQANAYIERTPGASVLCVTDAIYLADVEDQGEPA